MNNQSKTTNPTLDKSSMHKKKLKLLTSDGDFDYTKQRYNLK